MPCTTFRTAISARIEGEPLPAAVTEPTLDAHLSACPECRRWATRLRALRRATDDLLRRRKPRDGAGSPTGTV